MSMSLADPGQIIKYAYDDANEAIQVNVVSAAGLPPAQTEDAAHTTGDKGVMVLAVRNDSGGPLASSDGDYVPLTTDSTGALRVDASFNEAATAADGGTLPALTKVISGYDGTNVQVLKTDASGELQIDVLSSALPTGASTEATLVTLSSKSASSDVTVAYDYTELSYITVGNGIGEIGTVIYKTGGSAGTTVATRTLAYDVSNRLTSVTKS